MSFGPSHSSLRTWVRQRCVPLVMVVASHSVETTCQEKNGLNFVDLLRPFAEQNDVNAPLRVSNGQSIRITHSRLRFSYAHTMEQPTAEVIDAHLRDVVDAASQESAKVEGSETTPWFLKYREDFLRLLSFDAQETLDHPLGCIYAVSSSEVDSVKAFEDLMDSTTLPSLMAQEFMTPMTEEDSAKMFVVVHDGSREGQTGLELAKEKVRIVQKEFGRHACELLLINTSGGKAELRGTPPVAFEALRPAPVRGGGAGEHCFEGATPPKDGWGCYLSNADVDRLKDLVRNFMTRCFFPKLDMRISRLRSCVSYKRRGLAGKFMDRTSFLLKTSLSNIGRETTALPGFKFYSDESQMRQLGDILFLLGRYEDALEVFSAISVSKDQYPKFYAGVQLMMGLCYAMLVGFADPGVYFSRAYDYYLRVPGKISRMMATRAALLHSAHCTTEGDMTQAAQVLLKGYDSEEMLRGALLLEQAARLLLRCQPPSRRKFAFHMTLAGVWFYNCLFHGISMRCYNLVLDTYADKRWVKIEQHVAEMMLKFHLEQGNNADAFSWTISMLTSHHELEPEIQKGYIEWICSYIDDESHEVSSIADFSLPVVHVDRLEVKFDGEVVAATVAAEGVDSGTWAKLEGRFRDPFAASTTTGMPFGSTQVEEPCDLVVCGEAVQVTCSFENPLRTPIDVTSVQLLFEFERTDESGCPAAEAVSVPDLHFPLEEGERRAVQLELIPNTPGRLRVIGVSWFLNGKIPGHKLFGKVPWREDAERLPFRAKAQYPTLLFVALEPVPRLHLSSAPVPLRLWQGELWKNTWNFESLGKIGFRNLQITSSSGDFTFALSAPGQSEEEGFALRNGVYQMECEALDGLQFDVCFNPQSVGSVAVHTVLRYEAPQADTPLRARFLRHTFVVDVVEALSVRSWIQASEMARSYILALEFDNRLPEAAFDVHAIDADVGGFRIQTPEQNFFQVKVLPGERHQQHVMLHQSLPPPSLQEGEASCASLSDESIPPPPPPSFLHLQSAVAIALHYTSTEKSVASEEAQTSHHRPRHGNLKLTHDVAALAAKVDLSVESVTQSQTFRSDAVSFPVTIRVQNISPAPLSVTFKAGDEWMTEISEMSPKWRQRTEEEERDDDARVAGLAPMKDWSWSGQTERTIAALQPFETALIESEVVCFFPGSYSVVDYCCKWKALDAMFSSGVVPGKPLYLTVLDTPL